MSSTKGEKQVFRELSVLEGGVEEYLELSKQLGSKLHPVLKQVDSLKEKEEHIIPEMAPLAQALHEVAEKVLEANKALWDYIDRLEI